MIRQSLLPFLFIGGTIINTLINTKAKKNLLSPNKLFHTRITPGLLFIILCFTLLITAIEPIYMAVIRNYLQGTRDWVRALKKLGHKILE